MKQIFIFMFMMLLTILPVPVKADTPTYPPVVRIPLCLQHPDPKVYVPCTGVVPVDKVSGDALDWHDILKGSTTDPSYTLPVVNNNPVSNANPLPVTCANCGSSGSSGGGGFGATTAQGPNAAGTTDTGNPIPLGFNDGTNIQRVKGDPNTGAIYTQDAIKRMHWNEGTSPLSANTVFNSAAHDDGGSITGDPTRWSSFSCFATSDQPGTLNLQASNDGNVWVTVQTRSIISSGSVFLIQPIFTKYWRCQVMNGSVAQGTLMLNSAFGG